MSKTSRWLLCTLAVAACGKKSDDGGGGSGSSATKPEPSATTGSVVASLGKGGGGGGEFTPSTKGFKFQNYGNDAGFENLSNAELVRLFGPKVCAEGEGDKCILTPPAEKWRDEINKIMGNGHCEGMAVLALLFQVGKANPGDFGGKAALDLEIKDNVKLQREIAVWWTTQALIQRKKGTPTEIVDELTRALKTGDEGYTLAFFKSDGTGGHATTPYAVVDKGNGETWIMHYDNNFPGEERHISVDRNANTWKYFTAANPKDPGEAYDGNADTRSLMLAPMSQRLQASFPCPFCGDVDPAGGDTAGTTGSVRQVTAEGGADLLITDDSGKRVGHAGGKIVDEIPGANIVPLLAGANVDQEPMYQIPAGHALDVTLDGGTLKGKETTDVQLVAPGYSMGVYDVGLSPGEKDQIHFSADWRDVSYTTEHDETPEIEIGIETAGADYSFIVHASGESGGQKVDMSIDGKAGTFSVQAAAKDGSATYEVEVHRIDEHGEQVFKHNGIAAGAADKLVLHYADWKGDGQPMKAGVDKGGDGKVDEEEELTDE